MNLRTSVSLNYALWVKLTDALVLHRFWKVIDVKVQRTKLSRNEWRTRRLQRAKKLHDVVSVLQPP